MTTVVSRVTPYAVAVSMAVMLLANYLARCAATQNGFELQRIAIARLQDHASRQLASTVTLSREEQKAPNPAAAVQDDTAPLEAITLHRVRAIEKDIASMRELAMASKDLLYLGTLGTIQEELLSASVYKRLIADKGATIAHRAEAFMCLGGLQFAELYLSDQLQAIWVRDSVAASSEEDQVRLMATFNSVRGDESVQVELMRQALQATSERVRSYALRSLSGYPASDVLSAVIHSAKRDASKAVRQLAKEIEEYRAEKDF